MNKSTNNIGNNQNYTTTFISKLKLAAAVAAVSLGFARTGMAVVDVTSITTSISSGAASFENNVTGYGTESGYNGSTSFNMHYLGKREGVTSIKTQTGDTYVPSGIATTVVRRYQGPKTDIVWYRGTGNPGDATLTLDSEKAAGLDQAFSSNNILVGTDNLFTNKGNAANNNTNVERLDVIFDNSMTASGLNGFAIFDRGFNGVHDRFKIAAITSLDVVNQKPTNYGSLTTVAAGTWGKTDLTGTQHYIVTRRNNTIANDTFHASSFVDQPMGATFVPLTDLVGSGTKIYGYSLFAGDVSGSGSSLVDWKNTGVFPTGTTETNGGIDAIGTVALVYTAIPEPSSLALVGATGAMLLGRARKSRKV